MAIFPEDKEQIFNLGLDETGKAYLLQTVRWTKFLAIIGFIGLGLMILGSLSMMAFSPSISQTYGGIVPVSVIFVMYLVIAALYIYPIYCLLKFSTLIKSAVLTNNQAILNDGLRFQRNMFKFMGILVIVLLALYAVIIVMAIIMAAAR